MNETQKTEWKTEKQRRENIQLENPGPGPGLGPGLDLPNLVDTEANDDPRQNRWIDGTGWIETAHTEFVTSVNGLVQARLQFVSGFNLIYREGYPGFETFRNALDQYIMNNDTEANDEPGPQRNHWIKTAHTEFVKPNGSLDRLVQARFIFENGNGYERIYREGSPGFETFRDALDQEDEFFDLYILPQYNR